MFRSAQKNRHSRVFYTPKNDRLFDTTKSAHETFHRIPGKDALGALSLYEEIYNQIEADTDSSYSVNDKLFCLNKHLTTIRYIKPIDFERAKMLTDDILTLLKSQSHDDYHIAIHPVIAVNFCQLSLESKDGSLLDEGVTLFESLRVSPYDEDPTNFSHYLHYKSKLLVARHELDAAIHFSQHYEYANFKRYSQIPEQEKNLHFRQAIKIEFLRILSQVDNGSLTDGSLDTLFKSFWQLFDVEKNTLNNTPREIKRFSDTLLLLFHLRIVKSLTSEHEANEIVGSSKGYILNIIKKLPVDGDIKEQLRRRWKNSYNDEVVQTRFPLTTKLFPDQEPMYIDIQEISAALAAPSPSLTG